MRRISNVLMLAGTIPFIVPALMLLSGMHFDLGIGSIQTVLNGYVLVIASFMAGSLWGLHLKSDNPWVWRLPICSNVIALVLWGAFVALSLKRSLLIYCCCFLSFLIIDCFLYRDGQITHSYFCARVTVTFIVVVALLLSWSAL